MGIGERVATEKDEKTRIKRAAEITGGKVNGQAGRRIRVAARQ
jgi:hypothetical protein